MNGTNNETSTGWNTSAPPSDFQLTIDAEGGLYEPARNFWSPLSCTVGGVAIITTNCLTLLAIKRTPCLHSPPHRHIASLAVADAMVGVALIARSFKDIKLMSKRVNMWCITVIWILAAIYGALTYVFNHYTPGVQCVSALQVDSWYHKWSHPVVYFLSLIICIICYAQIVRVFMRQKRKRRIMSSASYISGPSSEAIASGDKILPDHPKPKLSTEKCQQLTRQGGDQSRIKVYLTKDRDDHMDRTIHPEERPAWKLEDEDNLENKPEMGDVNVWSTHAHIHPVQPKEKSDEESEDKMSQGVDGKIMRESSQTAKLIKTLAILVIVFIVSWLPNIVISFLAGYVPIPYSVTTSATILASGNSGVNFIIYAACNKRYRDAFYNLLCGCRRS